MYLDEQLGYMELSGRAIRFATPGVTELDSLGITLEPVQDLHGYEYPWPAGGGKNKYDIDTVTEGYYLDADGNLQSSSQWSYSDYIDIGASTQIAISGFGNAGTSPRSCWYDENKTFISSFNLTNPSTIVTSPSNAKYLRVSAQTGKVYQRDVQVEKGSSATTYAPYSNICPISGHTGVNVYVSPTRNPKDGNTYSVIWESEAGTVYAGTIDVTTGILTVTHKMVDCGTLSWRYSATRKVWTTSDLNDAKKQPIYTQHVKSGLLCSQYADGYINSVYNGQVNNACALSTYVYNGTERNNLMITDFRFTDVTVFTNAMSGVQMLYQLATPVEIQLDPVTIKTLIGINNIWTDTESAISAGFYYRKEHQPMAMNYDYCWTYPKAYIDKLEARIAALETAAAAAAGGEAKAAPETVMKETAEPETEEPETAETTEEPVRKNGKQNRR